MRAEVSAHTQVLPCNLTRGRLEIQIGIQELACVHAKMLICLLKETTQLIDRHTYTNASFNAIVQTNQGCYS